MVNVLGFDIGGANIKAAYLSIEDGSVVSTKVAVEYFPIWKEPKKLSTILLRLKKQLTKASLDCLSVTMTAELSDAYQTKRQGVNEILSCLNQAFSNLPIYVLTTNGTLESIENAKREPLKVAAANWAATGWLVAKKIPNCVIIDIGSTSASIIPIIDGRVAARGKTDLEKLMNGELVYTGSLRTNVAAIVHSIPFKTGIASVSSELFAQSGDVHLVLGHISKEQYTSETADGRGKTLPEARARLARVVCADTDMLTNQEIFEIANYIYEQQIIQVEDGLSKTYSYVKSLAPNYVPVVVTGLGKDFIGRKAAEKIGVDTIIDIATLIPSEAAMATPAYAVALMAGERICGGSLNWI